MRYVRCKLYPPAEGIHPIDRVFATAPAVSREAIVHLASFGDNTGVLLYHIRGDPTGLGEEIDALESVYRWEMFQQPSGDDGDWFCFAHVGGCGVAADLLALVHRHALVVETPIDICADGAIRVTVAGKQETIHDAFESLPGIVDYEIASTGTYDPSNSSVVTELTPRQRTVLRTATELGYYDVPKRATHDDIAAKLGCATSTVDEHLRKAESRVFSAVVR